MKKYIIILLFAALGTSPLLLPSAQAQETSTATVSVGLDRMVRLTVEKNSSVTISDPTSVARSRVSYSTMIVTDQNYQLQVNVNNVNRPSAIQSVRIVNVSSGAGQQFTEVPEGGTVGSNVQPSQEGNELVIYRNGRSLGKQVLWQNVNRVMRGSPFPIALETDLKEESASPSSPVTYGIQLTLSQQN